VHLPLIVRQPGGGDAGLRVGALTQPVDLTATLHDIFEDSAFPEDGHSWLPLLRRETNAVREYAVSKWKLEPAEEWAVRVLSHALLLPIAQPAQAEPRAVQLYLKPEDRWELNNVVQHHLEVAEELERKLRGHRHSSR
jgi:arylsulfatase A-like enzyme